MIDDDWDLAETVALELVNRSTDVNEVHKMMTNARVHLNAHPERVGQGYFTLLETVIRDGRYLVRSGRTLDYYLTLRDVSNKYLSEFRSTTAESGGRFVAILGWIVRFMHYYRTDAGESELVSAQHQRETQSHLPGISSQPTASKSQTITREASSAKLTLPKRKPAIKTETVRELVTLMANSNVGKARVQTAKGEEITCTGIPAYPAAAKGDTCFAKVVREAGRAVKASFKSWN